MMNALLLSFAIAAGTDVKVSTLDGPELGGELVEFTNENQVVLKTAKGEQTFDFTSLLGLRPKAESKEIEVPPSIWIDLVDGTKLVAKQYRVSGGVAEVVLLSGSNAAVYTRSIHSVRFRDYTDLPKLTEQWNEISGQKITGDTLVIRRSDNLDQLEGALGDITDATAAFTHAGQKLDIKLSRLDGFIYYHPVTRELPEKVCRVESIDGSQWNVRSLKLADEKLELVSVANMKYSLPLAHLRKLDFSSGNVFYLDDMEPEARTWSPKFASSLPSKMLEKMFAPKSGKRFDRQRLQLDGREYRGLSLISRTELTYRLTDKFRSFNALAGIDGRLGNRGHVKLEIFGDKKSLFSKDIAGKDEPLTLNLDIQGVRRLRIVVDFGEGANVGDYLNLCNARITK